MQWDDQLLIDDTQTIVPREQIPHDFDPMFDNGLIGNKTTEPEEIEVVRPDDPIFRKQREAKTVFTGQKIAVWAVVTQPM